MIVYVVAGFLIVLIVALFLASWVLSQDEEGKWWEVEEDQ